MKHTISETYLYNNNKIKYKYKGSTSQYMLAINYSNFVFNYMENFNIKLVFYLWIEAILVVDLKEKI